MFSVKLDTLTSKSAFVYREPEKIEVRPGRNFSGCDRSKQWRLFRGQL